MSTSQNKQNPFPLPDDLTHDYAIPYAFASSAIQVMVGDLCYFKGQIATYGDVAYPGDQFTSLTNEQLDQQAFASVFAGISQEMILSTETNKNKRFVLRTEGIGLYKCPSQTWRHGDLVGIYSSGSALDPQQVDKCLSGGAIGYVVKDYVNATTEVTIYFRATRAEPPVGGVTNYALGAINTADNISNISTETAFATTGTIPAQALQAGDVIHVRAVAQVTAQNSTNTNRFKLKIQNTGNNTTLFDSTALNIAANGMCVVDFDIFLTAAGASGAFYAIGESNVANLNAGAKSVQAVANTAINTNTAITIQLTDTVNAANAGNNATLLDLEVWNHRR